MPTLYVSHEDGILGQRGDALFYKKGRNGPGETIPIHIVDGVVVMGKGSVSTPALHFIMENDIPLHFIDSSGRYMGSLTSGRGRGYLVKKRQFDAAANGKTVAAIARSIAAGKLGNQLATLRRGVVRGHLHDNALRSACAGIKALVAALTGCDDLETIRGYEGHAAALYFSVFGRLLKKPWYFNGRNRRPPRDPINAMLSFGYTLLLAHVTSATVTAGLDPCVGFLHPEYRGRPSMALDLMEEYRSQVIDRLIISIANQMLLKPENFSRVDNGGVFIDAEARKNFIRQFSKRLDEEVCNEITGEVSTFRNHIFASARRFAASLRTGTEYLPFKASF
ncbi:MAG: CRISPR-associated endonuclease Cas1 [Synergistaceae bacterium]|jgi:CRISPR-associated protein Cas1|nr:CRISPR-associated endonuclease Cas1 [Synergistaceae bacterium]